MKKRAKASNRVATGIPGFDVLVEGGLPHNSSVLIAGGPGTGKTIFCMQYLVNGARADEKGMYVSFEQPAEDLRVQAQQFGWNLPALEKAGKLRIMCVPAKSITKNTIDEIRAIVKQEGIRRLVIDSLSSLVVNAPIYAYMNDVALKDVLQETTVFSPPIMGEFVISKFIYNFIDDLRDLQDCTNLLIAESHADSQTISKDTIGEYVCDGVILINFESLGGNYSRSLMVRKMRETKNNEDVHPVEISKKGIIVHSIER